MRLRSKRIHRTAEESSAGRAKKKLLGKSSWYKSKKKNKKEEELQRSGSQRMKSINHGAGIRERKMRAVLFIE